MLRVPTHKVYKDYKECSLSVGMELMFSHYIPMYLFIDQPNHSLGPSKFIIMSTESDKNISDWSYDCTGHKNGIDFFMRLESF